MNSPKSPKANGGGDGGHGPTTWFEDVEKRPIRWAMPDYIARGVVTSIYGPRNSGKTLCATWLAAAMSRGEGDGPKLRVWFNSQEDDLGAC